MQNKKIINKINEVLELSEFDDESDNEYITRPYFKKNCGFNNAFYF